GGGGGGGAGGGGGGAGGGARGRRRGGVGGGGGGGVGGGGGGGVGGAMQESARSGAGQSAMTEFFAQHLIARLATVVMVAVELATTGVKRLLGHRGAVGRQEPPRASGAPGGPASQRLTAPPAAPHAPSSRNA